MRNVKTANYEQVYLLPPSMEEWLEADHPARFIREFVEQADLKELGFEKSRSQEGGSYYETALLLRVSLYGYLKKIRSFRGMEKACWEDIGFIWLAGNQRPDHNSLWRFFNENKKAIGLLFKRTVSVAMEMKLVGLVLQAVDGTKIQAACSGRKGYNEAYNQKLLKALDQSILEQEQGLEKSHGDDDESPEVKLPEELKDRKALREKVKEALKEISEKELKHCHPQEIEARRMETDGRNRFSYNGQVVVDSQHQIIVAEEMTNHENDMKLLTPMIEKATAIIGSKVQTLADGGYATSQQFTEAKEKDFSIITPLPNSCRKDHPYHALRFKHDVHADVVICPEGKSLKLSRLRDKRGQQIKVYQDRNVCKNCPVKTLCTKDGNGRMIEIGPYHQALVQHREMLLNESVRQTLKKRSEIVEPVFAQIKANMGFRRWTLKGLAKVGAQWSLLCSIWNLKVIYRFWRQKLTSPNPAAAISTPFFTEILPLIAFFITFLTNPIKKCQRV